MAIISCQEMLTHGINVLNDQTLENVRVSLGMNGKKLKTSISLKKPNREELFVSAGIHHFYLTLF